MSKIARIYEPKFLLFFMRIAVLIVIIISTRVVFLRKLRHFLQFSPRLGTREINGGRKFSEIKVQKPRVLMFVLD